MQNRTTHELFDLVKGMTKAEKKHFYQFAKRNSNNDDLKLLSVYRAINSMDQYDEVEFSRRMKGVQCRQLPQLKACLYQLVLDSLRQTKTSGNVHLQLHQLMEHANILYDKRFLVQALKVLKKVKSLATTYEQIAFAFQAVMMEKKIELVFGNGSLERINCLNAEMHSYNVQLSLLGWQSIQAMLLYGWLKKCGTVEDAEDKQEVDKIFQSTVAFQSGEHSFYSQLYRLQAETYYRLLTKDWTSAHNAAMAWVQHFTHQPAMKELEEIQFCRGLAYLNETAFLTGNKKTLIQTTESLQGTSEPYYKLLSQINLCLLLNRFDRSLLLDVYTYLQTSKDAARKLKLCTKAATLCFDAQAFEEVVDFTRAGLNDKAKERPDLQYTLRKLLAAAHKKIGNDQLVEYLELSARRFAETRNVAPIKSRAK